MFRNAVMKPQIRTEWEMSSISAICVVGIRKTNYKDTVSYCENIRLEAMKCYLLNFN